MRHVRRLSLVALSLAVAAVFVGSHVMSDDSTKPSESGPVYELRIYTTPEGKLPELHKRFRDHTMKLFEKHGMKNVIYFVPADKDNTLVYLLEHRSRAAAEASWKAFRADPEWQKARAASEVNGSLVEKVESQFLTTVDYSPQR